MKLVIIQTKEQLLENLRQVERYLSGDEGEDNRKDMLGLIRRGTNFVAYKVNGEWRFAPSRFLGYANNNLPLHLKENGKDGKDTSPAIDSILSYKRDFDLKLEKEYIAFCELLGITPKRMEHTKRKYWDLSLDDSISSEYDDNNYFSEGKRLMRIHVYRERNSLLVQKVKNEFKKNHKGELFCEICGFNFKSKYKDIGEGYIEAHHLIPISEMEEGDKTDPKDMRLVCSNCHRMLHSKIPCYTMEEIKKSINSDV